MFRLCTLLVLAMVSVPGATLFKGRLQRIHDEWATEKPFDRSQSRDYDEVNFAAHGLTEISLERDDLAGVGPAYAVSFSSDGAARFMGIRHGERMGFYEGTLARWQFDALAQFAESMGFRELEHTYLGTIVDQSAVFTSVVRRGERSVVRNNSRAGPPALWVFEQTIEKLMGDVDWKPSDN